VSGKTSSVRSLNRRAEKRRRCQRPVTATLFVLPYCRQLTASVKDVSPAGIGLSLAEAGLASGARVLVQLPGPHRGATHTALAEVVPCSPEGGCYLVGCKFLSRLDQASVSAICDPGG
jgi:hypothetical protein